MAPDWLDWDLEISWHAIRRMRERGLSEVELRAILEPPLDVKPAKEAGRYVVHAKIDNAAWVVVVEPDSSRKSLVVVTAYAPT